SRRGRSGLSRVDAGAREEGTGTDGNAHLAEEKFRLPTPSTAPAIRPASPRAAFTRCARSSRRRGQHGSRTRVAHAELESGRSRAARTGGVRSVGWSTRQLAELTGTTVNTIRHYHAVRSEEHTSELQSRENLVCRLL